MFNYIPEFSKQNRGNRERSRRLVEDNRNRRTPDLLPRDEGTGDQLGGQGWPRTPHGGVFLDIASPGRGLHQRRLPSMYHQFKELADVDIPRGDGSRSHCHYALGGVRVDADTTATTVPGFSLRAKWPRLARPIGWAATRYPTCCIGRRAGLYALNMRSRLRIIGHHNDQWRDCAAMLAV